MEEGFAAWQLLRCRAREEIDKDKDILKDYGKNEEE
jgi:hypothetical protein